MRRLVDARRLCPFVMTIAITFFVGSAASAVPVTFSYEAVVATSTGTPFGQTIPLGTQVTGWLTYDTATADTDISATNGYYPHSVGTSGFYAEYHLSGGPNPIVTGSTALWVQVAKQDTLRVWDGPRTVGPQGGVMLIDNVADADLQLFIAITPSNSSLLPNDFLPDPFPQFPFPSTPHTFSIKDAPGNDFAANKYDRGAGAVRRGTSASGRCDVGNVLLGA